MSEAATDTAEESADSRSADGYGPGSHTSLVEGCESDRRRLTVDFAAFTDRLRRRPPLDHDKLARLMAGVDLVTGLAGPPDAGFGSATPGVGKEAELSVQLGAITDQALAAAEEILELAPAHEDEYDAGQLQAGVYGNPTRDTAHGGPEVTLAFSRLGNDEISAARQSLLRVAPATERAVADEFI